MLSIGQAENKLSHPDRIVRQTMFKEWEKTWKVHENTFAQILNHLGGFRLKVYQERGWETTLKEPLHVNRMSDKTLQTMWSVIEQNKSPLINYLNQKSHLLEIDQLSWYDVEAPLSTTHIATIPYDEAAELIISQFATFSPRMSHFAKHAFENRWIEAEDRPGKQPGGFCSSHPKHGQSRIFMTYSGTAQNLFTLAHELGHAYHNEALKELPYMAQQYRMNVAETASTLAEMIVVDSVLKLTEDISAKRALLDTKLQRAVIFLMNIHARYLFEMRFYEKRRQGFVTASDLNVLMEEAQKEAFCHSLSEWHPHFWVAKRHFYITDVPFYNFPYTFGYLFSLGIYALAQQKGTAFEAQYDAFLRDTGKMNVEELAQKHLDVDLQKPAFWQAGLDLIHKDIQMYLDMK